MNSEIDNIDLVKEKVFGIVAENKSRLKNCDYIDVRVGAHHIKSATAERGVAKSSSDETDLSLGIRVIAGDKMLASGFCGRFLGRGDFNKFDNILKDSIEKAHRRALVNSDWKNKTKTSLGSFGDSIRSTNLGNIDIHKDVIKVPFEQNPERTSLDKIVNESVLISKNIEEQYSKNGYNLTVPTVKKNVDLCLFYCSPSEIIFGKNKDSAHHKPEKYLALGELKGGIDPAGADEHWKTANSALGRIRKAFSDKNCRPMTFFIGAAIEKAMAKEIYQQLSHNTLSNGANLTNDEQVVSLCDWLIKI